MNYTAYPIPIHTQWMTYSHRRVKLPPDVMPEEREKALGRENAVVVVPVLMDDDCALWWPLKSLLRAAGARNGTTAAQYVRYGGEKLAPYIARLPNPKLPGPKNTPHVHHNGLPVLFRLGRYLSWDEPAFRRQTIHLSVEDVIDKAAALPPEYRNA